MKICHFGTPDNSHRLENLKSLNITAFIGNKLGSLEGEVLRAKEVFGSDIDLLLFQINGKSDGQLAIRIAGTCQDLDLPLVFCSNRALEEKTSNLATSLNAGYVRTGIFTLNNSGLARKLREALVQATHLNEDTLAA